MLFAQSKGLTSSPARTHESGFATIQIVVVATAIVIVCVFAIIWIGAGRTSLQLSNSAQQFAEHVERARADSIRRRAVSGQESSVEVLNATTYRLKMGFGGSSTLSTRDITLEGDTIFTTSPAIVSFDGRGRLVTGTETTFAFQNSSGSARVDVTGSGDVTVDNVISQDHAFLKKRTTPGPSGDLPLTQALRLVQPSYLKTLETNSNSILTTTRVELVPLPSLHHTNTERHHLPLLGGSV